MVSPVLNCILHELVWRARQSSRLASCFCNLDIEYLYWECLGWHGWNCITYCTAALDFLNIAMSSTTSPLSSTTTTVIATIATTTTTTPTEFFLMMICKQKAATVMMTASHRPKQRRSCGSELANSPMPWHHNSCRQRIVSCIFYMPFSVNRLHSTPNIKYLVHK